VTFEAPAGTPGLPDFRRDSKVGGVTPSLTYDRRDNMFTPLRGTFVEILLGVFSPAQGWNDAERVHNTQTIVTGGFGFRYELARMGLDIAFAPDNTAVYVQVGSAWARP
jgi:hypothetical protein